MSKEEHRRHPIVSAPIAEAAPLPSPEAIALSPALHEAGRANGHRTFSAIIFLLGVLGVVIFVQVVLSWLIVFNVINTHNDFVRNFLRARLHHRAAVPADPEDPPDFGGIDFSPLVVLIAIQALRILLGDLTQSLYLSG